MSLTDRLPRTRSDVRWALGVGTTDWGDKERLRHVLDVLVSKRAVAEFMPRKRTHGLQLVATDQAWTRDHGELARGPSLALALGLLGRAPALPLLDEAGVGGAEVKVPLLTPATPKKV